VAINAEEWLQGWVAKNLTPGYVDAKAEMQDEAKTCVADAEAAGITIAQIKEAAGGDLETYLVRQQNAGTDEEVKRLGGET